ncbi:MAG TPA: hypothetical protein VFB80_22440 [Pirellulaceae bacterium]|nr:hypothetical protein [Pirellulaceae bacterium]
MLRRLAAACLVLIIVGCGSPPDNTRSLGGSFAQIEGAVGDMHANVFGGRYSGDLGNDQLGFAMVEFQKSVKGTALEADGERLARKITEVTTLGSQRPPIAKLRTAVKELEDMVADIKKKL